MQGTKRATAIDTEMFLGGRGERGGTLCMQEKPNMTRQNNVNLFKCKHKLACCIGWNSPLFVLGGRGGEMGLFIGGGGRSSLPLCINP